MSASHVLVEAAFGRKCTLAHRTLKWLFTRMLPLVFSQRLRRSQFQWAILALKLALLVGLLVVPEMPWHSRSVIAMLALESRICRMHNDLVFPTLLLCTKCHGA